MYNSNPEIQFGQEWGIVKKKKLPVSEGFAQKFELFLKICIDFSYKKERYYFLLKNSKLVDFGDQY